MNVKMYISASELQLLRRVNALLNQLQPEAEPQALVVPGSPELRGDVIIFTGSFNPPTTAHLALLRQAQRYAHSHGLMRVYAAFTKLTVDKERVERPLLLERILLLRKVLQKRVPHTGIMLFNRGLYVEQAEAIRRSFPKVRRILLLMGFDKVVQIFDPRYYADRDAALEKLFSLAELLVVPRGTAGENELAALLTQPQNKRFARYVHALPFDPAYRTISSTRVRQDAAEYTHDVPQEVRQFMRETRAYAPPLQRDGREVDYYEEHVKQLDRLLKDQRR